MNYNKTAYMILTATRSQNCNFSNFYEWCENTANWQY